MIKYSRGCIATTLRVFQVRGSVFPNAFVMALPCGVVTALLKFSIDHDYLPALSEEGPKSILQDSSCWSGVFFLVGFLIIFRTSQAYQRFCDGCTAVHKMRAEWFDASAALVAFCKCSTATPEAIHDFQHILVRLFSILHAVALADIEDSHHDVPEHVAAFKYELLDGAGLDAQSIKSIKTSPAKVELVFQWIQQLIVENLDSGILKIPPPILSRAFQELANGMVAFHEAMKLSSIPFPFPYTQTCELLLIVHWLVTPLVVSQYTSTPWWGGLFSFLQVFIYWCLNAIAVEIENPFGLDANDLNASDMQKELNVHLLLLLDPATMRTPRLMRPSANGKDVPALAEKPRDSLAQIWDNTCPEAGQLGRPIRRGLSACSLSSDPMANLVRDDAPSNDGRLIREGDATSSEGSPTQGPPSCVKDAHAEGLSHWNSVEAGYAAQLDPHSPHSEGQYALEARKNDRGRSAARGMCVTQPGQPPLGHVLPPERPLQADSLNGPKSANPSDQAVAELCECYNL